MCLDVKKWKAEKKLKELPLPTFYGFGSTVYNKNQYRFIVIEKFDKDLEEFLKTVSNSLLLGAVINIVRQLVNNQFLFCSFNLLYEYYGSFSVKTCDKNLSFTIIY